jgi:hypothetical protein
VRRRSEPNGGWRRFMRGVETFRPMLRSKRSEILAASMLMAPFVVTPTCSENPVVDSCPARAEIDVERSLRIATGEVDVRRGNQWFYSRASRRRSCVATFVPQTVSIRLKIRAPASLHDSGTRRHPASKGPHDVSVPMPSRVGISGPARRGVQCGANSR